MGRLVAPMGYALASLKVGSERKKVRYMYRETPDSPEDSGWRFFSGEEEQDYVEDPNNVKIYDVNTIAEIDPSIITLLQRESPCAFERQDASSDFREVDPPLQG